MGKVSEQVSALVTPIAESMGLTVLEVLYEKKFDGMNLTIVIDKEGGVTIDDCEMLHKAIDAPLDELDPIENSYTLNVSSPGLDRPLKLDWDYKRNLGKKISVKLYKPLEGKKTFQGVLASFDETSFVLDTGVKQITFLKKDTAVVLPVIEF
ncbi:MAG: ribosome maturation factor RimP [Candidatus Fimimonas sp.]